MRWWPRVLCALRGHDIELRLRPRFVWFQCLTCGWESDGWILTPKPLKFIKPEHPCRKGSFVGGRQS
jgi:hypothetical protein